MKLGEIAHARSGDKGNQANIGVVAYDATGYARLRRDLTIERVGEFFRGLARHTSSGSSCRRSMR